MLWPPTSSSSFIPPQQRNSAEPQQCLQQRGKTHHSLSPTLLSSSRLYYLKGKKKNPYCGGVVFFLFCCFSFLLVAFFYASSAHQVAGWTIKVHLPKYPCKRATAGGSDELKKKKKKKVLAWLKKNTFKKRERQVTKMTDFLIKPLFLFLSSCATSAFDRNSMGANCRRQLCVLWRVSREDGEIHPGGETAFAPRTSWSAEVSQVIPHCFARTPSHHYPPPSPLPRLPLLPSSARGRATSLLVIHFQLWLIAGWICQRGLTVRIEKGTLDNCCNLAAKSAFILGKDHLRGTMCRRGPSCLFWGIA